MARFLLISIYDEYNLGVRQLVSNLRQAGHEAYFLALKQYAKKHIEEGEEVAPEWQVELRPGGGRAVFCYPFPITDQEAQLTADLIRKLKPDAIGLSAYSPQISRLLEVTQLVRNTAPGVPVLWGGPHATLDPNGSALAADYVIVGEGDVAILDFAEALDKGRALHEVPSVAYKAGDKVVRNPLAPLVQDLNTLPFTYHGNDGVFFIDDNTLYEKPFPDSDIHRSHKILSSRGCPYACTYCMLSYQKEVMPESTKLRFRSIQHTNDELEEVLKTRGNYFCEIMDDIFTLRPERMEDFFEDYRARVGMPFWCYTHPQYARETMLNILRENNAQWVVMGIESGSNRVANEVFNRKVSSKVVIEAAHRIKNAGLRGYYDLISNNPFEDEDDRVETFHLIRQLPKPFELQLVELNFYPNIKIDRMLKESGLPRKVNFDEYRFWNALYHLASAIEITDREAERFLANKAFREDPVLIESLASEAKRLASALGDAETRNRNYEIEVQKQVKRAETAELTLQSIRRRRGFKQFIALSEGWRKVKRRVIRRNGANGINGAVAANGKNGHGANGNNGGTAAANGVNGDRAQAVATNHGGKPGQYDVVTDMMAPHDFRQPDSTPRESECCDDHHEEPKAPAAEAVTSNSGQ